MEIISIEKRTKKKSYKTAEIAFENEDLVEIILH